MRTEDFVLAVYDGYGVWARVYVGIIGFGQACLTMLCVNELQSVA